MSEINPNETTTDAGTTASPATDPPNATADVETFPVAGNLDVDEREELEAYRAGTAAQAAVDQAISDRNAAQHDPVAPVPAGTVESAETSSGTA